MRLEHEFEPVYNKNSKVLILGSFPSAKSREQQFYYGHPKNRFWPILSEICDEEIPRTTDEKRKLCLKNGIALWDVIESCDIEGSADSSIRNAKVNDLTKILNECNIRKIFVNGTTAYRLFEKYQKSQTGKEAIRLPSTSPANAAWSFERLFEQWKIIKEYI